MELKNLEALSLSEVLVTDGYLVNAAKKECEYLISLDTDRLLAGFRETANLEMKGKKRYAGWEDSLIGGHTMGHYLTACVQACESAGTSKENRAKLLDIIMYITKTLKQCQDAQGTGFIFGSTVLDPENMEKQFDNVERGLADINTQAWVPWYTMHKIFEGLLSVASMTDENAKEVANCALETVSALGDWVYGRTSKWSPEIRKTVLSIEYGGMNDALYDLYLLTGNREHKKAAECFDERELFEKVLNAKPGDDVLNNIHANTTIPKFMGALKGYVADNSKTEYLEYARAFWELVTEQHTYVTGGNSEWEHFGRDGILDAERTNTNCETCNAYNMLKLTKLLFMITGEGKYADWYENTFINSILSSQNPETGMTTYFQPMASGYFKVFGSPDRNFWCCTGTGMENFSKLSENFYYKKDNVLIINQYYSSSVELKEMNIILSQTADIPNSDTVSLNIAGRGKISLLLRLPEWLAGKADIKVNGETYEYVLIGTPDDVCGYAVIENVTGGTDITVKLPMTIKAYSLPDSENTYAFKYGPVLLSAKLGRKDMNETTTGVSVSIPASSYFDKAKLPSGTELVRVAEGTAEHFIANIARHLVRDASNDGIVFKLVGTDADLEFVPHYSQHTERYAIYLKFGQ